MIATGDYLFVKDRYDLEKNLTVKSGSLFLNGGFIKERPQSFPCFLHFINSRWELDNSGKEIILEHLSERVKLLEKQIEMIEKVEVNG